MGMKRRFWQITIAIALVGTSVIAFSFYQLWQNVRETASIIYEPLPPPAHPVQVSEKKEDMELTVTPEVVPKEPKRPLTMLLFGVDKRGADPGRTDTLIFLAVHPEKHETLMFSIPRDTRTTIISNGKEDKINHAYSAGGIPSTVRTVEHFLDIPIDYYVKVEMEGFSAIVDTLGGVTVENAFAFDYEGYHFPKGSISMDGNKALAYARMRYEDPEGDFGRNKRQQQIIRELMSKGKQVSTVGKLDTILANVGNSIKTNLALTDMQELMLDYKSALEELEVLSIRGEGGMIGGIYYYLVTDQERKRLKEEIEQFLKKPVSEAADLQEKKGSTLLGT
ncbi:LytR family transcriptional regulator [Brevibacillus invocatus]|uniref:LytR family transcriptional regulator n=2 Tax=Brevibacillus TaxID=55080 RepID=A0A3M8CIX6_9BACL|nr:LCP family protein [Brevibacillus sp. AY1]RNB74835.1 LytR family transcriptional regulator [Brevibacillus invocatus]